MLIILIQWKNIGYNSHEIHTCTHTCTGTQTHTHTHTHTSTHTHTHTHTLTVLILILIHTNLHYVFILKNNEKYTSVSDDDGGGGDITILIDPWKPRSHWVTVVCISTDIFNYLYKNSEKN